MFLFELHLVRKVDGFLFTNLDKTNPSYAPPSCDTYRYMFLRTYSPSLGYGE